MAKKSTPLLLPENFPLHAPLPPGGPWIRPTSEQDWDDEVTVPIRPPPESSPRATAPESGVHVAQPGAQPPPRESARRVHLGHFLVPSLTPLALVEAERGKRSA